MKKTPIGKFMMWIFINFDTFVWQLFFHLLKTCTNCERIQIIENGKFMSFYAFLFSILILFFMGGKCINFSTVFHIFYDVILMLKSSIDIAYIHIYAIYIVFINWECRSKFPNKSQFSLSFCYLKIKSFKEDENNKWETINW